MNGFWDRLVLGPQGVFIRDDSRDITYEVDTEIKWKTAVFHFISVSTS